MFQWKSPREVLQDYEENRILLEYSTMYECARMTNFDVTSEVMQFLKGFCDNPIQRYMPVKIECRDGTIFVLPGKSKLNNTGM